MPISREDFFALDFEPDGLDDIIGNFILKRDPARAYSKNEIYKKATRFAKMHNISVDEFEIDKVLDMLVKKGKVIAEPKLPKRKEPDMYYIWVTGLGRP